MANDWEVPGQTAMPSWQRQLILAAGGNPGQNQSTAPRQRAGVVDDSAANKFAESDAGKAFLESIKNKGQGQNVSTPKTFAEERRESPMPQQAAQAPALNPRLLNPSAIPGRFEPAAPPTPEQKPSAPAIAPVPQLTKPDYVIPEVMQPNLPAMPQPSQRDIQSPDQMLGAQKGVAEMLGQMRGGDAYGDMEQYLKDDASRLKENAPSDKLNWNDLARFGFAWGSSNDAGKSALAMMDYKAKLKDDYRSQLRDSIKNQTDIALARQALAAGDLKTASDLYFKQQDMLTQQANRQDEFTKAGYNTNVQAALQGASAANAITAGNANSMNNDINADRQNTRGLQRDANDATARQGEANTAYERSIKKAELEAGLQRETNAQRIALTAANKTAKGAGGYTAAQETTISNASRDATKEELGIGQTGYQKVQPGSLADQYAKADAAGKARIYDQTMSKYDNIFRGRMQPAGQYKGDETDDTTVDDVR
jgi:hypothetical protein